MTEFVSTRNEKIKVDSKKAIVSSLASDGGLYIFQNTKKIESFEQLKNYSYQKLATAIIHHFFTDFDEQEILDCVNKAYDSKFDCEEIVPLKKVGNDYFLELWHGPTSAFKDLALTFLPHILTLANRKLNNTKPIVILTATSGDTGKAALEGFKNVENTYIKVLYPYKMVSMIQERQMVTTNGTNVEVMALRGNFDHCQQIVKEVMENYKEENVHLSSANSINIARLIAQVVYYFKAYFDLINKNEIQINQQIDFIVPTGNFGDILAGYVAKIIGLPIHKLVCASNINNVLTEFINTGIYDSNRQLINTISPSIDILVSSNLERLLYLKGCPCEKIKEYMQALKLNKRYQIDDFLLKEIQKDIVGLYVENEEIEKTIKYYYEEYHYLIDTHTAVAAGCALKYQSDYPKVILSTASPYKFAKDVYHCISNKDIEDNLMAMDYLSQYSQTEIPKNLKELKNLPVLHQQVIENDCQIIISKLRGIK